MNKTCKSCGKSKPIDQFYKHPKMGDGHLNVCIACKLEYKKSRAGTPAVLEAKHRYYEKTKAKTFERSKQWAKDNPEKRRAQSAVWNALLRGKIVKPKSCQVCGREHNRIDAHHPDYSRPLDVMWVCPSCHRYEDRKRAQSI